jgi:hypothetical protein
VARRKRALRSAAKTILGFPVPGWLGSLFGGGAAVGTGVATKAVAVTAVSLLVAGGTYEAGRQTHASPPFSALASMQADVARAAPVPIASPRGKERDDGHREQTQRTAGLAHVEHGQARREKEGQARSPEQRAARKEVGGERSWSARGSRRSAHVLEKAPPVARGRGLATARRQALETRARHSTVPAAAKAHGPRAHRHGLLARRSHACAAVRHGLGSPHARSRAAPQLARCP